MYEITITFPITSGTKEEEQESDYVISHWIFRIFFRFRLVRAILIEVDTPRFLGILDKALTVDLKTDIFALRADRFSDAQR